MKYLLILAVLVFFTSGCASTPEQMKLHDFAHADILNAAKIADANGFPARAGVWRSFDTLLTAAEAQVAACKAALAGLAPKQIEGDGVFTLIELGAEKVGGGIPASVKITCEPIVIPTGLL